MAHFAQLDENNIVTQVIVVNNETIDNLPFPSSEPKGIQFCQSLFGNDTRWAQTSYNSSFRYNFAGQGFAFNDAVLPNGAFIPPKPYNSWVLNEFSCLWESPIPYPDDANSYFWDEETKSWIVKG